jgi:NAD(P)-dependent dehydrogenase (short-subunit alcohol dehydrogenase family)
MASELKVNNLFDFSNHVALVTGGATGLGEMAAQGFVQNGARVFIASRKESELKKVRRKCFLSSLTRVESGMRNECRNQFRIDPTETKPVYKV